MWLFNPNSDYQLTNTLTNEKKKVKAKEREVLLLLIKNEGQYVSKEQLFNEIWHNRVVSDTSITQSISQLRIVLGDNGKEQRIIKTKPKMGYMLVPSYIHIEDQSKYNFVPSTSKKTDYNLLNKIKHGKENLTKIFSYALYIIIFIISSLSIIDSYEILSLENSAPNYNLSTKTHNDTTFHIDNSSNSNEFYTFSKNLIPKTIKKLFILSNPDTINISCIYVDTKLNEEKVANLSFTLENSFDFILEKLSEKCN